MARKQTKSSNGFLTAFVVLLVLACVAVGVIGWQSEGWQNWEKFKTEGEVNGAEEDGGVQELPAVDENGNEIPADEVVPMPQAMTFRTAKSLMATTAAEGAAYDSVTLSATVKPDSAADKTVDWTVEFVNPSSEWATAKTVTDYVTVTPQSDGATVATVQCLQPFGEQIRVTVISRMNTEAKASCPVDFAARPTQLLVSGIGLLSDSSSVFDNSESIQTIEPLVANSSYLSEGGKYMVPTKPSVEAAGFTPHTVGEVVINSFKVEGKPSSGYAAALEAQGFSVYRDYQLLYISLPSDVKMTTTVLSFILASGIDTAGDGSMNVSTVNSANIAIINNMSSNYDLDVRTTIETNVGTFVFNNQYKFNRSAAAFGVESVALNNSAITI